MLADAPYDTAAPVPGCAVSAEDDARSDMAALRAARRRLACNNYRAAMPAESDISRRIGIHQGDIVVEDGDIFGDGVNVAVRLEALAEPGVSAFLHVYMRTPLVGSIGLSKTSASKALRISPAPCTYLRTCNTRRVRRGLCRR